VSDTRAERPNRLGSLADIKLENGRAEITLLRGGSCVTPSHFNCTGTIAATTDTGGWVDIVR
jgi:hypothetical protein